MASLPTYTVEMPILERSASSPALSLNVSLPQQSSPSMSYFPSAATPAPGFAAMPLNATPAICRWIPSPSTPHSFPQFSQSPYQFAPLHPSLAPPTYPAYGYTYFPTALPSRFPSMSAVPTLSSTATIKGINGNAIGIGNGAKSSSCANPMDIFGTTSPELAAIPMGRALPAINFPSPCSSVYSPVALKDQLSGGKLKRGKSSSLEKPNLEPMTSRTAQMDHALTLEYQYAAVEVPPRKRSRTARACERCRIRKARCFGGNPCNRCIKRKFACDFRATRKRGTNKPRRDVLPSFGNHDDFNVKPPSPSHAHAHAHAIAQPYHRTHPAHAHPQAQGSSLARARRHTSGQHTKSRARRPSVHSVSSASGVSVPSLLKQLLMHAGSPLSIGLGVELTPSAEEDAEGWSDPDVNRLSANANANATAMSVSLPADRSMSWTGFGAATMFSSARDMWNPSVANTTGTGMFPAYTGDLNLYTSMLEEDMIHFSPLARSQPNEDMEELFDFPFTPLLLTIPLPLQPMSTAASTWVSQNHTPAPFPGQVHAGTNTATTSSSASPQDANDLSADPTLLPMQDDFFSIRNGARRELYRNPPGGDLFRQPFQAQSSDAY